MIFCDVYKQFYTFSWKPSHWITSPEFYVWIDFSTGKTSFPAIDQCDVTPARQTTDRFWINIFPVHRSGREANNVADDSFRLINPISIILIIEINTYYFKIWVVYNVKSRNMSKFTSWDSYIQWDFVLQYVFMTS